MLRPTSLRDFVLTVACSSLLLAGCPQSDPGGDGDGGGVLGGLLGGSGGNRAPTAVISAAPASNVFGGTTVTLDGSASTDPEGESLSFAWSQTAGDGVALSGAGSASVTFVAPFAAENATVSFKLDVTDSAGNVGSAELSVAIGAGGEFSGNPQSAAAYRDSLSPDEAYHLMRRATFGGSPLEVERAVARGLNATLDDLLTLRPVPQSLLELIDSYEEDADKVWLTLMIDGPNPLQERLALFWHDRFASARRVLEYRDRMLGRKHLYMLRTYALGNYRDFLEELTLDPLMLIWLDGANSPKQNPNENYAREFWELFTLGRDVLYTEQDIKEGARGFTGITLLRDPNQDARPIYDLTNHDETLKSIFPQRLGPGNYDYNGMIDLTLAQPEAARYVARNLFVALVHDHPSDALVDELAAHLKSTNWELGQLVRRLLASQAMFSADARLAQVASPVEHVVGVARTLEMHIVSDDSQGYVMSRLAEDLAGSGQELLNPPGVQGWDEDDAWLEGQWLISRVRALGRNMEYGPANTPDLPYHVLPAVSSWSQREARGQIVDAMARVFHLTLAPIEHELYTYVLDEGGNRALYLQDEDDRPRNVFEMIRLMAMHEQVIGR